MAGEGGAVSFYCSFKKHNLAQKILYNLRALHCHWAGDFSKSGNTGNNSLTKEEKLLVAVHAEEPLEGCIVRRDSRGSLKCKGDD